MTVIAKNPILPGFYPDPSVCAVGEDFYLVNSTFAYFPGIPVMHSKDLAHWEQAGNAMHRASQLPLKGCGHSQGLFAPTIRYHEGTFYVICTNVSGGGNFIVTAASPEGPWSEPFYIEGTQGIDPSLFFDEDGACYYIGTRPNPRGCRYNGDWYIWIQELDIQNMKLMGEPKDVWNGAMKNIIWPEGPHLYKKDGYYYILHAEGGTGPDHAVTVCRSRDIWGPYENNFCNPILTHRHLGKEYPIKYVGHGDLVETPEGEWYMVMLAVRPIEGYTTMGRETFLAKVIWENGWPVVNPGEGRLTDTVEVGRPEWHPLTDKTSYTCRSGGRTSLPGIGREYDFTRMEQLGEEFLFLRNPARDMYRLDREGLHMSFGKYSLKEKESPSYVAIRQQHHHFQAAVLLSMQGLENGNKAGLALVQSNEYHLRLEVSGGRAQVISCEKGEDKIVGSAEVKGEEAVFFLLAEGLSAAAGIRQEGEERLIVSNMDIRSLSTETAGGFVGCTVGLYAAGKEDTAKGESQNPQDADKGSAQSACFKEFSYGSI